MAVAMSDVARAHLPQYQPAAHNLPRASHYSISSSATSLLSDLTTLSSDSLPAYVLPVSGCARVSHGLYPSQHRRSPCIGSRISPLPCVCVSLSYNPVGPALGTATAMSMSSGKYTDVMFRACLTLTSSRSWYPRCHDPTLQSLL